MSLTFTHPLHPSQLQGNILTLPLTGSSLSDPSRDPHDVPTFDSTSLIEPKIPVFYLPPLLSSLPANLPASVLPIDNPPLVTETRLPDIDPASLSLHKSLHRFRPLDEHYADTAYSMAFNWHELSLPVHEEREWYCVVFRSKRKAGSDGGRTLYNSTIFVIRRTDVSLLTALYEADKKAHEEAVSNGGVRPIVCRLQCFELMLH